MLHYHKAVLLRIIDADTIVVDIDCDFHIWLRGEKVRLFGINSPEMNTPEGKLARTALVGKLFIKPLEIETYKADKQDSFGRWLATVWTVEPDGVRENVNQWLVDNKFAVPYMV